MTEGASGGQTSKQNSLYLLAAVPLAVLIFYSLSKFRSRGGAGGRIDPIQHLLSKGRQPLLYPLLTPSRKHLAIPTWDRKALLGCSRASLLYGYTTLFVLQFLSS